MMKLMAFSRAKLGMCQCLMVLAMTGCSASVWAASADLTLAPTRIVLEKDTRYATVNIKNAGDGTGRYRIEIVDAVMQPNGGVKLQDGATRAPFSAIDHLSISPRSMTLSPGDYQTVRILVKNANELTDGEYRSALKVTMTETDIDAVTNRPKGDAVGISIKPKLVMAIPLIVRHGDATFHVKIEAAQFVASGGNNTQPQMHLTFGFDGTRSVIGDVKITHVDSEGKESLLKFYPGVAIYRGVPKIDFNIPLEVPNGVNIHSGKTTISYLAQNSEGGNVMAQTDITP
jgi:hypothetical protein